VHNVQIGEYVLSPEQSHNESVVSQILRSLDNYVQQIPRVGPLTDTYEFSHDIVTVERILVMYTGDQAQKYDVRVSILESLGRQSGKTDSLEKTVLFQSAREFAHLQKKQKFIPLARFFVLGERRSVLVLEFLPARQTMEQQTIETLTNARCARKGVEFDLSPDIGAMPRQQ